MRTAFIRTLIEHARIDPRIFLVVGDLGYSVVEPFASEFPDRFLNAGVAEQNMTGMAAGLAAEGYRVVTYSIANFPTLRCLEQIRNDVCYHNLPVTIVSVGAGFAYGNLGFSHHAIHDIAAMRGLPHISIASPADPHETVYCTKWLLQHPGPSYLRLGKAGEPQLHTADLLDHHPVTVMSGNDPIALCATGSVLSVAIEAASLLRERGISPTVFSVPFLAPTTPRSYESLWRFSNIVTIEEHVQSGGFGSLLRELAPDHVRIRSLCAQSDLPAVVGTQAYLRASHGLTADSMATLAATLLGP